MREYGDNFLCPGNKEGKAKANSPDANGQEFIWKCIYCRVGDNGICRGDRIVCCNDLKNNSYDVSLMRGARYVKQIAKGKDEILSASEVDKIGQMLKGGE